MTSESARRLLELRADPTLQTLVDSLAEKSDERTLSPVDLAQHASYLSFATFVAPLKFKARP